MNIIYISFCEIFLIVTLQKKILFLFLFLFYKIFTFIIYYYFSGAIVLAKRTSGVDWAPAAIRRRIHNACYDVAFSSWETRHATRRRDIRVIIVIIYYYYILILFF